MVGPVTVSSTGSVNGTFFTTVATFANGNILVTYTDTSANTLRYQIYNSSLTVVTSGSIDTAVSSGGTNYVSSTSFGDGSHVAVGFLDNTNFIQVRAVKSDGTVTARLGPGLTATTDWKYPQVIGLKSSAFVLAAYNNDTSNNVYSYVVRQTGASSFLAAASSTIQGSASFGTSNNNMNVNPIPSPGTTAYFLGVDTGPSAYRLISMNPLINTGNQTDVQSFGGSFSGLSLSGGATPATIGYTALGTPVIVAARTAVLALSPFTPPMNGSSDITTAAITITTVSTYTGTSGGISAIPHIGEAILIGYLDSNQYPAFTSIAAMPFTTNATLTAGTDISTSTLVLTPEGGYSLQGISVTAAASGSSGLVQTRGTAALNSNYSAATPATLFDFRNPLTFGTNGMVIGRTVIMGNN